jgi:hypothetical protein
MPVTDVDDERPDDDYPPDPANPADTRRPSERWRVVWGLFVAFDDPPLTMEPCESLRFDLKVNQDQIPRWRADLDDFVAGGIEEERCAWFTRSLACMYDPLVEFASYREFMLWLRDELAGW